MGNKKIKRYENTKAELLPGIHSLNDPRIAAQEEPLEHVKDLVVVSSENLKCSIQETVTTLIAIETVELFISVSGTGRKKRDEIQQDTFID